MGGGAFSYVVTIFFYLPMPARKILISWHITIFAVHAFCGDIVFLCSYHTVGRAHLLHVGWRNLFSSCAVCCVSFWFWREKSFGSNMHVLLEVQYSCGGVLVFWLQWEIVFGVLHILSVQYSCAVVSVFGCSGK